MENDWYIVYNGQQVGPMRKTDLIAYGLNPNSMVWNEKMPAWAPAYTVPELMTMMNQPGRPGYAYDSGSRSRVVAGILAILLGCFGVQYFYCGKIAGGFITIILNLVTCGIWSVLMLAQGIYMLTLDDAQFNAKYVNTDKTLPLF